MNRMLNRTVKQHQRFLLCLGWGGVMLLASAPAAVAQSETAQSEAVESEAVQSEAVQPQVQPSTVIPAQPGLLRQAQAALREERYEEAADLWRQLALQWPDSAEMSYNLGVAYHRLFNLNDAANAYLTATVLNPNHAESFINLSLARIQLQQYDEALAALDQVLLLPDRPSDPVSVHTMAHYNRAIVLGRQGQTEAARAAVDAALAITPDFLAAQALVDLIR